MTHRQVSDEAQHRRMKIWKHNSFIGHCCLGMQNMNTIESSPTATHDAKALASSIRSDLDHLRILLKDRVDG